MTVRELIKRLEYFDDDMDVYDASATLIEVVEEITLTHDSYNIPDEQVVRIW